MLALIGIGGKRSAIIASALFFVICAARLACGQINYTVGNNEGEDQSAFFYSPFYWTGELGELEYIVHVCQDNGAPDTSGQKYLRGDMLMEYFAPWPGPTECTLDAFLELISENTDYLGTLLISTHGGIGGISVEGYENYAACSTACDAYVDWDGEDPDTGRFTPSQVYWTWLDEIDTYAIAVKEKFISDYALVTGALVFVGACYSWYMTDDFCYKGARVAVGNIDDCSPEQQKNRTTNFFSRMDGKAGRLARAVWLARSAPPADMANLDADGQQNTTLSPAVASVVAPDPLKFGDTITITFDTKCDTWAIPLIYCDWGYVCSETWMDDSVTLKAVFCELAPSSVYEVEFTLPWDFVFSARNWSVLDGYTKPPWGGNAEGPAIDDYVWTMPVAPCDCTVWGDVDGTDDINPVDVVYMVNCVYLGNDMRVQHTNCPHEAGDVNCDGLINPPDVVLYINKVYLGNDMFCDDPCYWLEYATE